MNRHLLLCLWIVISLGFAGILAAQAVGGTGAPAQGYPPVLAEDGLYHGTGFLEIDPARVQGVHAVDPSSFPAATLLAAVDNSAGLPPVQNQGWQNSCGAWAIGYYMKTYSEAKKRGWSLTDPAHQFSPAFIFNQDYKGPDSGSYWADAMLILQSLGCATLATMPYNPADYTSWPSEAAYKEAIQYRIGEYYRMDTTQTGSVDAIKQVLAGGRIGMGAIRIYENFRYISTYNNIFSLAQRTGSAEGWHATTIVGYDDAKVTPDGVGAFRCVNSWGTNWGDAGFYWLTYQALADANKTLWQGAFFYFDELPLGTPTYAAKLSLSYPRFRALGLTIGNPAVPSKSLRLFDLYAYSDDRTPEIAAPAAPIWVDLALLLPLNASDPVPFQVQNLDATNGKSGQISAYSLVRLSDSAASASAQTPAPIPADGTAASVSAPFTFPTPCTLACTATVPATGATGVAVAFQSTATPSNCTGTPTFAWTFGDGVTSTLQNPSRAYAAAGTLTWTLTVALGGATCTKTGTITISGAPACTVTCTATVPASGNVGVPVSFQSTATPANCTGAPAFAWTFGDGGTSAEQNPSRTYATVGTYSWTMTATAGGASCAKTGTIVVAPAGPPPSAMEVNQVLGRKREGTNSVPQTDFVAGKDTAILVTVSTPVTPDVTGLTQKVEVYRGGSLIATLAPSPSATATTTLTFLCPNRGSCGDWAAGSYRFVATVNGGALALDGVTFQARKPLKVLAVPIKANYAGAIKTPDDKWKLGGDYMRSVYPTAYTGFKWEMGLLQDLSAASFDLTTNNGQFAVWQALAALQPRKCAQSPGDPDCYQAIIGFIKERIPPGYQGYTFGAPASIVVNDDQDMPATVAHEVAHTFGIGDEYQGGSFRCDVNPPPPTYTGTDWTTSAPVQCSASTALEAPQGSASRIVAATDRPFEVGGRGALTSDLASYMGSGAPQSLYWTTPPMYQWLFGQFKPVATVRRLAEPVPFVEVRGVLDVAGGTIAPTMPWYTFDSDTPSEPGAGDYRIQAEDAEGTVLAFHDFTIASTAHSNPPRLLAAAPFETAVEFPETTARLRLLRGDTALCEVPVSENDPHVNSIEVPAGPFTGPATISWTGSDPDGGTLWYDLEYSPTGIEEDDILLAEGTTDLSRVVDFSTLPGGPKAILRVTVSDGIRTGSFETGWLGVPVKPPEIFISEPAPDAVYAGGEEVTLEGDAYDLQDGWLSQEEDLTWFSDRDGELGSGPLVFTDDLSAGTHVITLAASNHAGLAVTKSITITVGESCSLACEASAAPDHGNAPLTVQFTAAATLSNCSAAPAFAWVFGDGGASDEQNPAHAYAAAGSYPWSVTVTADSKTCIRTGVVTVETAAVIPGDCDGDGTVSIGEVQKAINMFLGTLVPGCGVDCNGDGTVSIGEVQKVINAFLGVTNSC